MIALIVIAGVSLALFAVMFVPLERAFPARAAQRPWRADSTVDLAFFAGQYLAWSTLALAALTAVRGQLDHVVPASWRHDVAALPLAAQVAIAIVAGDLLVYAWHRACHAVPLLWRFHAVHHTTTSLDWLAAHREHPLDGVTTQLVQNLPAMILALSLREVVQATTERQAERPRRRARQLRQPRAVDRRRLRHLPPPDGPRGLPARRPRAGAARLPRAAGLAVSPPGG